MSTVTDHTYRFVRGALTEHAGRILEIGCGDGALAVQLSAEGFSVVAIDSDEAMIAIARSRGVDARTANWPNFSDGQFDAVLFTRSLHHVEDLTEAVAAAFACLAPGGQIVVEDFDAGFSDEASLGWFSGLLGIISAAGYQLDGSDLLSELVAREQSAVDIWQSKRAHGHRLHTSEEIRAALQGAGHIRNAADTAYFFRYLAAAIEDEGLVKTVAKHETELIEARSISALGKRFIAY